MRPGWQGNEESASLALRSGHYGMMLGNNFGFWWHIARMGNIVAIARARQPAPTMDEAQRRAERAAKQRGLL